MIAPFQKQVTQASECLQQMKKADNQFMRTEKSVDRNQYERACLAALLPSPHIWENINLGTKVFNMELT